MVIDEMKRIILDSGVMACEDKDWPKPDKIGKQEFVVRIGDKEINLTTSKIGSYG
jgi:protein mago nashi